MADTVRYLMEEMIPELEDLEKKGYFSRSEVKQIASKRQDFEYALKRRAALKRDFLRYIEYETKLEELRRHRRKERGIKGKKGLAEMGMVRRVHFIYERATRKFKADLSLWLAWIDYCKRSKSTKQFSKVVTKALHRHSHIPVLWVEAALWEFEHTGNVAAARSLMQRGLRHCPKDEGLWVEYCRLELLYVARLRARRAVLGLPNPEAAEDFQAPATKVKRKRPGAAGAEQEQDEDALPQEGEEAGPGGKASEADQDSSEAAVRAVLTGVVVRSVIKGAVAALPASISLRTSLLAALQQFSFVGVAQLVEFVYSGIADDFPGSAEAVDVLARRHWAEGLSRLSAPHLPPTFSPAATSDETAAAMEVDHVSGDVSWEVEAVGHQQCCQVYESALAQSPTPAMYQVYVRYLGQRTLPVLQAATAGEAAAVQTLASLGAELLLRYQAALDAKAVTEGLCAGHVDWAMALNQPKVAVRAARRACELFPGSVQVWSRRLSLELELHARRHTSTQALVEALSAVLGAVPAHDAHAMWGQALQAVPPGEPGHDKLQQLLLACLVKQGKGAVDCGLGQVVGQLLQQVHQSQGVEQFRRLYSKLVTLPPPGAAWFKVAIDLELQSQGTESKVQQLFEAAVSAYGGEDVDVWLRFARFSRGALKGAGDVYWRATKSLADPAAFIEQYQAELAAAE